MNNTKTSLDQLFDVDSVSLELIEVMQESPTENAVTLTVENVPRETVPTTEVAVQESDFELARGTIRNLIKKGEDALDSILKCADESEKARDYEVAATLIKTTTESVDTLMSLHQKRKDFKENLDSSKTPQGQGQTNIIDKAVFVGSPSDLLNQVKYGN